MGRSADGGRRGAAAERAHAVEMLLGELQVAAGRMGVAAVPRPIELSQGPVRMVADLVVHGCPSAAQARETL
ncbi:MAG: hypothetical protein QOJ27_1470 [Sphingomonadales bacterium]|nr:hypothetical protein [Sphingomonadales bacterium]